MTLEPRLTRFRAVLCTLVVLAGLLEFMQGRSQALIYSGGVVALVTLLAVLPVTTRYTRVIALILCLSGLAAAIFSENLEPWKLVGGVREMTPLMALLAAVMLLGIALELGRFADLFDRFYINTTRLYQSYIFSLLISYVLSFLSLLGAVAPSYYLVNENLKKLGLERGNRFETTSIARGYAMAIIVSPAAATVGIALKYSGLSWLKMVEPIFLLSITGLLAAFFVEPSWRSKKAVQPLLNPGHKVETSWQDTNGVFLKRLLSFFLLFAGVIGTISFLGNVLHFSSLNSISAGCLLVTFAWGALSGNLRPVLSRALSFFENDIMNLSDQIVLFIAAGFFTFSMEHSGRLEWLGYFVEEASGRIGTVALLSLVPLLIMLLAMIGLHPFASGIIIAKALSLSPLYFNPLGLAAALMSGMSMSFVVSPFSGLILILASFTGKSPYRVGIRWNISFVITFLLLTSVFIALVTKYG
jgi:hypothetical protein